MKMNIIPDGSGNIYCSLCGFKVHPLNKRCRSCGLSLVFKQKPSLYKRSPIKKKSEANKVKEEGRA